jgi:hypothetical protein
MHMVMNGGDWWTGFVSVTPVFKLRLHDSDAQYRKISVVQARRRISFRSRDDPPRLHKEWRASTSAIELALMYNSAERMNKVGNGWHIRHPLFVRMGR